MTTQHLEEAEELADGLAMLETGKLVSQGTVDEIKKRYGVGYNLRITGTSKGFIDEASRIVSESIPESYVSLRSGIGHQTNDIKKEHVNYVLPLQKLNEFPKLFERLENVEGIEFKVVLTSLEEAFLNFSKVEDQQQPVNI